MKKYFFLKMFVFVFILIASIFTLLPSQVSAGWTEQTLSGSRNWSSITSSSDGAKLAATVYNGYIYTSTDSGATWTEQTLSGSHNWSSIASSYDMSNNGTKLVAVSNSIYTSIDSGATWVFPGYFACNLYSVTSSSDGTKLAAADRGCGIYTSLDSGTSWTQKLYRDFTSMQSIASSYDGVKLAAVSRRYFDSEVMRMIDGVIYTSSDSGATWTNQTSAGSRNWYSIASSSDGTKLIAVSRISYDIDTGLPIGGGSIYTSSDSGATWTDRTPVDSLDWYSVTSSSDGTKLAAVVYGGYIYVSNDSGDTWTTQTSAGSRNWTSIAYSSDGTQLAATASGGYIYTTYAPDDTTPDSFTFTDQTGVALSTSIESNTITVAGINVSTPISISSCTSTLCEYKINSGTYTSTAGTVVNGDTVTVHQTSSATEMTTTDLTLDIGGVTDIFSVTTSDATNPVITLTGSSTIDIYKGDTYTDQGATATDNIDGDITANITTVNNVDTNTIGTYTVTYNVDDAEGNHATEVTRIVNVNNRPSSSGGGSIPTPIIPTVTPSVINCLPGYLFDTNTGLPCTVVTPVVLCPIGDIFSTETGARCTAFIDSPTSVLNITRTLKITTPRMTGLDIKDLQTYLNNKGYDCGLVDGVYGTKTKAAVIKFQLANQLKGDGAVGPLTRGKMK